MIAKDLSELHIGKIVYFSDGINYSNSDYEFKAILTGLGITGSIIVDFEFINSHLTCNTGSSDIRVHLDLRNIYSRVKEECNAFSNEWKFFKLNGWENLIIDTEVRVENER